MRSHLAGWLIGVLVLIGPFSAATTVQAKALFNILYLDPPGEGFDDLTPVSPIGGNAGTTLGEQRRIALEAVVDLLGCVLTSDVRILVGAEFRPLPGDESTGVLGQGGAVWISDWVGVPLPATWYPTALANRIAGFDLEPPDGTSEAGLDIGVEFNSDVDGPVLGSTLFYYGLDGNAGLDADFFTVALHELVHGLGFSTLLDVTTGATLDDLDDVFLRHLEHHGSVPALLSQMTPPDRLSSIQSTGNLHWTGPSVLNAAAGLAGGVDPSGHVQMYAPNPSEIASTANHFDTNVSPDDLMEPFDTGPRSDLGLASALLEDIGWGPVATDLTDADGDLIPAACDPCPTDVTNLCIGACARIPGAWTTTPATFPATPNQHTAQATLIIKGLNGPPGQRDFIAKGFFNPATTVPEIDPKANGLRVLLKSGGGALLDVDIPGDSQAGADYALRSELCGNRRDGWTRFTRRNGVQVWKYRNRSGRLPPDCLDDSAQGISTIVVKLLPTTPVYQYAVKTRNHALGGSIGDIPLTEMVFELVLGAGETPGVASQQAIDGQCTAFVLEDPGTGPLRPFCREAPATGPFRRLICKGL